MPALPPNEPGQFDQSVFDQDEIEGFNFPEPSSEDEGEAVAGESTEVPKKGSGGKAPPSRTAPGKPSSGGKTPRKALAPKAKPDNSSQKTQVPVEPTLGKKRKNAPTPAAERETKKPTSRTAKHEKDATGLVEDKSASSTTVAPPSSDKKNPTTRKTRSPTARPHRRLAQEVVDFRVEKIESRVARLSKQIEVAVKHLKAYKKEIEYRRLEQEEEVSSDEARG